MQSNAILEVTQAELFETGKTKKTKDPDYVESVSDLITEGKEGVERRARKTSSILGIRCRRSDCGKDLHCFDPTIENPRFAAGVCQDCGTDSVDWQSLHARDPNNIEGAFHQLNKEWIRNFFFNVPVPARIESEAQEYGLGGLEETLIALLRRSRMQQFNPIWDRWQTPMLKGTIINWAQHATGCCCRRCLSYWHNIPLKGAVTVQHMEYLKQLVMRYVVRRIPSLSAVGPALEVEANVSH